MRKFLLIASVFVCLIAAGCKKNAAAEGGKPGAEAKGGAPAGGPPGGGKGGGNGPQVYAVTAAAVSPGRISDYLFLSGDIIAGSVVDAYSDAAGKITRVVASVGSRVAAGQELAYVDPSKPGMTYVQHIVRSPITGTITSLPAEVGRTISVQTSLATISGGGGLEIQLFVPERYVAKIKQGLNCEITLDAYPGESFRGTIREVSPTIDVSSRTMAIKVNVDNQGSRLKPGMFAKVRIITESREDALRVPSSAVVIRQEKEVVFIVVKNEAGETAVRQVDVTQGISSDGISEITSGLKAGDEVIDKGMTLLSDGARVNIIARDKVE